MTSEEGSGFENDFFGVEAFTGKFDMDDSESEKSIESKHSEVDPFSVSVSIDEESVKKLCDGCKQFIPIELEFCSEVCKRKVRESRFQRRRESIIGTKTLPVDMELRSIKSGTSFDRRQTRFVTRLLNKMKRSETSSNSGSSTSSNSTAVVGKDLPDHFSKSLAVSARPTQKKTSFRIKKVNSKVSPSPPTELHLAYSLRPKASPLERLLSQDESQ